MRHYVIEQYELKEALKGIKMTDATLKAVEDKINAKTTEGYHVHTIDFDVAGSKGVLGGDRMLATVVYESDK